MTPIVNILIYQIVWFLCICFGNTGALIALLLLVAHLVFSDKRREDLKMMGTLLGVGLIIDGTLNLIGFFSFNRAGFPIPFWLVVIWIGLATLVHHSLAWLKGRTGLCALFGALGGPMAYWGGIRMGAAAFNWELLPSLLLLAVVWGFLWPTVMRLAAEDQHG